MSCGLKSGKNSPAKEKPGSTFSDFSCYQLKEPVTPGSQVCAARSPAVTHPEGGVCGGPWPQSRNGTGLQNMGRGLKDEEGRMRGLATRALASRGRCGGALLWS